MRWRALRLMRVELASLGCGRIWAEVGEQRGRLITSWNFHNGCYLCYRILLTDAVVSALLVCPDTPDSLKLVKRKSYFNRLLRGAVFKAVDEWEGDEKELVVVCTESVKSVISLLFCQRKKTEDGDYWATADRTGRARRGWKVRYTLSLCDSNVCPFPEFSMAAWM